MGEPTRQIHRKGFERKGSLPPLPIEKKLIDSFAENLRSSSKGMPGEINFEYLGNVHDVAGSRLAHLELFFMGHKLAHASVESRVRDGKRELDIEWFSGTAPNIFFTENFKKDNQGVPWNVAFIDSIVKTAYMADYDRVLLRDIRDHKDYKDPVLNPLRKGSTIEGARKAMQQLYTRTANVCGFSDKGRLGPFRVWILNFPR